MAQVLKSNWLLTSLIFPSPIECSPVFLFPLHTFFLIHMGVSENYIRVGTDLVSEIRRYNRPIHIPEFEHTILSKRDVSYSFVTVHASTPLLIIPPFGNVYKSARTLKIILLMLLYPCTEWHHLTPGRPDLSLGRGVNGEPYSAL